MPPFRAYSTVFAAILFAGMAHAQSVPAAGDQPSGQIVQVVMADFSFAPNTLQFHANQPYDLRLTNSSGHGHSFTAPEFFAAVGIAPKDQSKVVRGEVEVDGGETVDVRFVPSRTGTYKFHCSHFLHASFGMTGHAVIQ
jgi:uncharacterized cupredoxin-like copper-binding protein